MISRTVYKSHDEWLQLRLKDVTASDIGALFGDHPFRTMLGLYQEKATGEAPVLDSAVLRRGKRMERCVAEELGDAHPDWEVVKETAYYSDHPTRIGATPDFLISPEDGLSGIMQAKTVGSRAFAKRWTDESPPLHVVLQTMTEMMLTNVSWGMVAALVFDEFKWELKEYKIPRDERVEKKLRTAVDEFWQRIANNDPPPADYQRDGALIASLYPVEVPAKSVDLTRDNRILEILGERERLAAEVKPLEEKRKGLDSELKEKLGDAEIGIARGWKITWKTRSGYQTVVKPSRVLRVLQMKEG